MRVERVLGVLARRGAAPLASPLLALLLIAAVSSGSAAAATPGPDLTIHSLAIPTHFSAGDNATECLDHGAGGSCDGYQVTVTNSGGQPAAGPITITDALPAGLTVREVKLFWSGDPVEKGEHDFGPSRCTTKAEGTQVVRCTLPESLFTEVGRPVEPDDTLEMLIYLTVETGAVSGEPNMAAVTEGGSLLASTTESDVISAPPPPFGPSTFLSDITGPDRAGGWGPYTQAAGHPYELTSRIDLNTKIALSDTSQVEGVSVQGVRDVVIDLPLGFLGSVTSTPQCTFAQLQSFPASCPPDTRIGHISTEPRNGPSLDSAIYNMVPEHGVMAEFGYVDFLYGTHALYASIVPTRAGYVLRITARELPQVALSDLIVTLYGDPAEKNGGGAAPSALFTNPSDCSGEPLQSTVHMDSWQAPGPFGSNGTPEGEPEVNGPNWVSLASGPRESPPVTGCHELRLSPDAFSVKPDTTVADSPTGLTFDLRIPQSEQPGTLATPPLQNVRLQLPEGMTFDPSGASGLAACSQAQIGWLGGSLANFTQAAPTCPEASKIGLVEVTTPLLAGALTGPVYLASQDENPFGSVLAVYGVIEDPATGVLIKLPGELSPNPRTGRITVTFDDLPQLPLSELKLRFFAGPRAKLTTPESCATFTTTSDLTPWSAPYTPDATPFDSFQINEGCVSGFAPLFTGGSTSLHAGGYSPLQLSFARSDTDQELAGLSVTLPPGLLANLSSVPRCSDADANAGTCPQSSLLGSVLALAGPGPDPLSAPGSVYLTGPYNGGPYGLVLVVPVIAGPFHFGTIVVRASLRIDPHTAQVTLVTDPFPTILDVRGANGKQSGIPIRMRSVHLNIDREGFMVNPTSCDPSSVSGTLTSTAGAAVAVSSRFQLANCATLPFRPKLTALTRANGEFSGHGASLHMVITTAPGQANMRSLKLDLPQRLPARLETIQKACRKAVFDSNPAACPMASVIGAAAVQTPILATPMEGPAILVSHGGKGFPDMVLVLQAQGVRIDLTGALYVDAHNITSTTLRSIPDVPIRRLDLLLPEGARSILAASSGLCTKKPLTMLTAINAQNGARVKPTVKVAVSGCKKPKRPKKKPHPTRH
jgi:hypothetical protein